MIRNGIHLNPRKSPCSLDYSRLISYLYLRHTVSANVTICYMQRNTRRKRTVSSDSCWADLETEVKLVFPCTHIDLEMQDYLLVLYKHLGKKRKHIYQRAHVHTHTHTYIYIYTNLEKWVYIQ